VFSDGWEGYLNERQEILDFVSINDIKNVVFLSGDVHMTILSHVKDEKGRTGAVEYTTPSISSDNLDELLGDYNSSNVWITRLLSRYFKSINPHIVKLDTTNHGYLILEVTPDRVQGDVWFISDPRSPSASMEYAFSAVTSRGEPQLTLTSSPLV
jgi:alkaline phosphatase D